MKYLKRYNESSKWQDIQDLIYDLEDMVSELKDDNINADVKLGTIKSTKNMIFEIHLNRPFPESLEETLPLIYWKDIKDIVVRITEYCINKKYTVRFWSDGTEFMKGFKNEQDFNGIPDGLSQFNFRMALIQN